MKKLIVFLTVCVFAVAGKISAQSHGTGAGTGKVAMQDFHFITLKEGVNKMTTVDGKETVQFVKRGEAFSEVVVKDAAGKATTLLPAQGVIKNAPKPTATKFRYMYWGNDLKNTGMVISKNDAGLFNITLDLPNAPTAKAQNRRVEVKLCK